MNLEDFIKNFASQFEETNATEFQAETEYKKLEEWSSLLALSVIAMADESYGVKVKGEDIRNTKTIKDLFEIVKSRL